MSSMYPSFGGMPGRSCMSCGTPLTTNETQCSRCGTYNPLPQGQQFGMSPQRAQGDGPGPSGSLWTGQPPQNFQNQAARNGTWPASNNGPVAGWGSQGQAGGGWQQNNLFYGGQNSAPPSQPLQQNLFGTNFSGQSQSLFSNPQPNPNQSSLNNSFNNSFANAGFQQNAERPSLNTFFQATQQNGNGGSSPLVSERPAWMKRPGDDNEEHKDGKGKNRPGAGVVVVIVILVLVLLGGGGFGSYYVYTHRNNGNTANNTANGPQVVTPGVTPLFSDNFQNNNANWNTTPPTGAKVTLANDGKLVLESDNHSLFSEPLPGGKTFGDLRVDVDTGLASGDPNNGYGVYIRASSNQDGILSLYYRFEIYGDGSFVIYKGSVDNNGALQANSLKNSLQPSNAIARVGKLNHLTIIAQGQTLSFAVNGTTLTSFTDPAYKSGTVALFVSQVKSATTNAQAIFEHLAVFPAQ